MFQKNQSDKEDTYSTDERTQEQTCEFSQCEKESESLQQVYNDLVRSQFKKLQKQESSHQSQEKSQMQLSLLSFWNIAPEKMPTKPNNSVVQTQEEDSNNNNRASKSKSESNQIVIERSMEDYKVTLQMSKTLYNTAQYYLGGQKDIEKKKLLEDEEQDSKTSWLIDTEIIEITKRLWRRKCDVKKMLQFSVREQN